MAGVSACPTLAIDHPRPQCHAGWKKSTATTTPNGAALAPEVTSLEMPSVGSTSSAVPTAALQEVERRLQAKIDDTSKV